MARKLFSLFLLAGLLTAESASAASVFTSRYLSFQDVNGDGVLSCGDVVTIGVFYATDPPPVDPTELHGFITMPDTDTQGLSFLSGSVTTNFAFTAGCFGIFLEGNSTDDSHARVEVSCVQDPVVLPGGATLAMTYQALYTSPTFPQFTDTATLLFDQRPPGPNDHLHSTETRSTNGACSAPPPTVTITKHSMEPATPGSPHIYSLTIQNLSSLPLGGFYARETVPANSTFDPANSSPAWVCTPSGAAGAACSYLFSSLNPGQTTITFSVLVAPTIPAGVSNITNTACVAESRTVYGCSSISDPFSGTPAISITKAVSSGTPAAPGGVVSFQIDVLNTSPYGSGDVVVTDNLPDATTYTASGSSSAWSCSGSTCSAHLGALASGLSKRLFIAVTIPSPLPAGGANFVNTACATPVEGGSPVCSSATFGASGTPILNLKKTLAQGDGTPGTDLSYDLTIRNDGNQDATGVIVNEDFPTHTTPNLAASEPGWTCASSACSFSLGSVNAGNQRTIRFTVTVDNPLPAGVGALINTACPAAPGAVTACDTISTPPKGQVLLKVTKTIVTPGKTRPKVLAGTVIKYLISVNNTGNQDAAAVSLQETLPAFTTFDAADSDPWTCASGAPGDTCTIAVGPLAAGATTSRRFALRVGNPPANTNIRNTACASDSAGASGCGEIITDPDTPTTLLAELSAAMAADNDATGDITPGDVLEYSVLITNTGTAPAGAVTFQINAPDHTTLIPGSVSSSTGTVTTGNGPNASTVAVDLGNLDAGATATVTYRVTIDPALPENVTSIISQGSALSTTAAAVLTDDPATAAPADPTIVPVRHLTDQPEPKNVPTLGQLGLILLGIVLAAAALFFLRRRRTT